MAGNGRESRCLDIKLNLEEADLELLFEGAIRKKCLFAGCFLVTSQRLDAGNSAGRREQRVKRVPRRRECVETELKLLKLAIAIDVDVDIVALL